MLYADTGIDLIAPDPDSTRFVLTVFDSPMAKGGTDHRHVALMPVAVDIGKCGQNCTPMWI